MSLIVAVDLTLPAANIAPGEGLGELNGFLLRAARDGKPAIYAVQKHRLAIAFAGRAPGAPDTAESVAVNASLALVPDRCLDLFNTLLTCWVDDGGRGLATVHRFGEGRAVAQCLARSWMDPTEWEEPRFPAGVKGRAALDFALQRVAGVVSGTGADLALLAALKQATRLVDVALKLVTGEAISSTFGWTTVPAHQDRVAWLAGYTASVEDEWRRVTGETRRGGSDEPGLRVAGPLSGRNVFLSYARSDGANLAWPVYGALQALGATVWFDQVARPDQEQLDGGFLDIVRGCDSYVACATSEFFERAGYAVQELAWALQLRGSGAALRTVVVAAPNTVLPSILESWPIVEIGGRGGLQVDLADALLRTPPASSELVPAPPGPAPLPLPYRCDRALLAARRQHMQRYWGNTTGNVTATLANRNTKVGQMTRKALASVHDGLAWDGALVGIDAWPDDNIIRDIRLRLATLRTVVAAHWPLGGMCEENHALCCDMEVLAMQVPAILEWPVQDCWDDSDRRYGLRHHLSALRLLSELLQRGVDAGLLHVDQSVTERWHLGIQERRRELIDGLLQLRVNQRLSWARELPTWGNMEVAWEIFLRGERQVDRLRSLDPQIGIALLAASPALAPILASLTWRVSRGDEEATHEAADLPNTGQASIRVRVTAGVEAIEAPTRPNALSLQVGFESHELAVLAVAWNQLRDAPSASGSGAAALVMKDYAPDH